MRMSTTLFMARVALLLLITWPLSANAILRTGTIDDTNGIQDVPDSAPVFSGGVIWTARTGNVNECPGCRLNPDPNQMFDKTWHDGTMFSAEGWTDAAEVSFSFNGTAVYIYVALLVGAHGDAISETHLSFYIDGIHRGNFNHVPTASEPDGFLYQQMVFSAEDLPVGRHKMVIATRYDIGRGSVLFFDYAKFTWDDGQPDNLPSGTTSLSSPLNGTQGLPDSKGSGPPQSMIIGLAVGISSGTLLALSLIIGWLWMRRSKVQRARRKAQHDIPNLMAEVGNPSQQSIGTHSNNAMWGQHALP